MRMHVCVSLACAKLGESESGQVKILPTVGCRMFCKAWAVNVRELKSNSKSDWDRACSKWCGPRNLTLPSEACVTADPRAAGCGVSRWCGHFRQSPMSPVCCHSPFSQSHVHIVRQRFAP